MCRQRKVACDRRRPRCGLCSKNDFDCEYKSRQQRPGLRAGYVSRLETQLSKLTTLAPSQSAVRGCEVCSLVSLISPRYSAENVEARLRKVEAQLERESHAHPRPINHTDRGSTASASPLDGPMIDPDAWGPSPAEVDQTRSPSYLDSVDVVSQDITATPELLLAPTADKWLAIWVQKYQPWFPILHQGSMCGVSGSVDPRYALAWKAVTAVVVLSQEEPPHWEQRAAEQMARDVVLQGLTVSSLQTVQALLIISNHYYANGNHTEFWNILAMCKK